MNYNLFRKYFCILSLYNKDIIDPNLLYILFLQIDQNFIMRLVFGFPLRVHSRFIFEEFLTLLASWMANFRG